MSEASESPDPMLDILNETLPDSILDSGEIAKSSPQNPDIHPSIENDGMDTENPADYQSMFVSPGPEDSDLTDRDLSTPALPSFSITVMEDDEDVEMVLEEDCTPTARERWSKQGSSTSSNVNSLIEEPPSAAQKTSFEIARLSELSATRLAQNALLKERWAIRQNEISKSQESASQMPTGAMTPVHPSKLIAQDEAAELAQLNEKKIEGNESEENAWMINDSEDDDVDEELENHKARRNDIRRRMRNGKELDTDSIELLRCNELISTITRRQELANRPANQSPDTMDSEFQESGGDNQRESHGRRELYTRVDEDEDLARALQEDYEREAPNKTQARKAPRKRRCKVAKTAAEFTANEISKRREKEREKQRKKKDRQKLSNRLLPGQIASIGKVKGSKNKIHGNAKGKEKSGPEKYPSRMKNGKGVGFDPSMQELLENMLPNDAIADRIEGEDYGNAPVIHESVKAKQMKALLASVPDSYDTHRKKADNKDILRASKRFGFGNVKARDGKWLLKGMHTPMYHHQLLAADFMVSREFASQKPHGGLLADAMGLGKTLETLATMVGNPPSPTDLKAKRRTTLIVVPASAIKQWQDEIEKHVKAGVFPNVLHYRAASNFSIRLLANCDIIITSYAEVMASFPFPKPEERKEIKTAEELREWMLNARDKVGQLHNIEFYRVVLDEAHAIKNFKSRTSLACVNLKGRYRWAISGTPIQNRLEELYPYFRFLRADWAANYQDFRRFFSDPDAEDATMRIGVLLSICMIRRTMKDTILGRPIVDLPKPYAQVTHVEFTRHERALYRVLEDRFRDGINQHFKEGTAQRNYCVFMVQLLRLRQCVAHPFLLEQTIKDIFTMQDLDRLKKDLRRCNKRDARPIYEQISIWTEEKEAQINAAKARGENPDDLSFGRSDFGKYFRMETLLKSLSKDDTKKMIDRVVCRLCSDFPQNAVITEHVFCRACIENYLHEKAATWNDDDNDQYTECPACRQIFSGGFKNYNEVSLLEDDEADEDGTESSSQNPRRRNHRGKGYNGGPRITNSKWLSMCIADKNVIPVPSAKTVALKATILKWITESPEDKILIFTQFRMMARIVGLIAEKERWGHVYFTGDMNTDQRHNAVRKFHNDPDIRMIAGLKCGGQALNLTCANRCISLDLWWNHSVEMQAFGRIFRIGQTKETLFHRIVVRNTVDIRLLHMQADKIRAIDRAMQDTGSVLEPLNMHDLASLFGHLIEDENGVFRVERDYEDEAEDNDTPEDEENDTPEDEDGAADDHVDT